MPTLNRHIVVLGSTGSIGRQTLDVVRRLNSADDKLSVVGLAAGKNISLLESQIREFKPRAVSVASEELAGEIGSLFPELRVVDGSDGLIEICRLENIDLVVNALVGAIGLESTLETLRAGCDIALANKESLVIGGELVDELLELHGSRIFPIDSEHNAVWQCLQVGKPEEVRRLILTASGGPFLHTSLDELKNVTPDQALSHPNWSMGKRITIDSSTMVNKAFEVIEAHYLFSVAYDDIDVVVHRGSVVHSMVEYNDGSIIAEMAAPDMRIPIQYALTYPEHTDTRLPRLNVEQEMAAVSFEALDRERFSAFDTVVGAGKRGGTAPAVANAVDEILVQRFLEGELAYTGIAEGLRTILGKHEQEQQQQESSSIDLDAILAADLWGREEALSL